MAVTKPIRPKLSERDRVRRTTILALRCLTNIAFYRSGVGKLTDASQQEFYRVANSNNFDIAVLEWFKVFGEWNGEHHWRNIFSIDPFREYLLSSLKISQGEFSNYISEVATYRDTFIAHLDDSYIMNTPKLDTMHQCMIFLLNQIHNKNTYKTHLSPNLISCPEKNYDRLLELGAQIYNDILYIN